MVVHISAATVWLGLALAAYVVLALVGWVVAYSLHSGTANGGARAIAVQALLFQAVILALLVSAPVLVLAAALSRLRVGARRGRA